MMEERTPVDFSRRQFVIRGGQAVSAVAIGQLLAGCGGGGTTPAGTTATDARQAKRGGTLRFSQTGTPPGYDPQKWWNAQAAVVGSVVAEPLIRLDPYSGRRTPALAVAEPAVSDDGRTFTFKLRPGVKFHGDNGTMTADDVKFSWERLMSKELGAEAGGLYAAIAIEGLAAFTSGKAKHISGLKAVDDVTFAVTLEKPDSAFLPTFSYVQAVVLPRSYYEGKGFDEVNWKPVGTGPFMLESAAPTTGARIVRNPGYWASGEPHLDAVQIDFNVEPQLAILKIQKSQQDMMLEPVPAAQVLQLQNDPQAKGMFKEGPQDDCQWISLPTQLKPFDDVRVRKAVAMAVDKEKLVKVVKGLGQPANGTFFSPLSPYFEDGVAYAYDPEQAKALLSEAGLSGGFTAPFWYQDQPPYADMGPAIVEDLAQVGIKLDAKPMVYDQFVQKTNAGPPAMIIFAWEDAYRHGAYIVDSAFTSAAIEAGCCNYPKYSSKELNALAAEGHSEDLTKSADAYRQIGRIVVAQEVLWVPLLYPRRADLVNTQVQGFNVARYPSGQARPFERYSLS